uniref:Secreted protein n=1 Tax=Arabidopsis thaliana TaxID=3702 RepID=Q56ZH0_ARATH|nr:hypothetical protein [Arabidopsis thaliana]
MSFQKTVSASALLLSLFAISRNSGRLAGNLASTILTPLSLATNSKPSFPAVFLLRSLPESIGCSVKALPKDSLIHPATNHPLSPPLSPASL